jgi:signal transduction histidine kinase
MSNFFKIFNNKSSYFYTVIISSVFVALTIIGISSFSFYLDDYSHSFSEMFRLQNTNLIETSNTLELGTRLEATKKSGVVKCILAKADGHIFYQLNNRVCESGLFSRAISVNANGRDNFTITFEITLPWKVQIAFIGFLILNLLVFTIAYMWVISHENVKLKAQESLSLLSKQVAHDIRSPLTALNMTIGMLANVQESQRVILRSATNRIKDIANELLHKDQSPLLTNKPSLPMAHKIPENSKVQLIIRP